jgi:glyoxylase-like metal-dependent hydrolase (beta-lactamase superfamily II)
MSRFWKIALATLALLLAFGVGAWHWLTAPEVVPDRTDFTISLEDLRALAAALPGDAPTAIRSALVAEASLPRAAVFAGESFAPHPMVHQVFEVVYSDGSGPVVIDTAFPEALLARMSDGRYHADAFRQVLAAMGRARAIVVTHEHFDHLAGVAAFPRPEELAGRLRLTREQLGNAAALDDAELPAALRSLEPLDYEGATALAPGVALMKAPGHTPGSQLVFVRTAEGLEYLFVGDVAWHLDQLVELHYRPRLVTDFFLHEDRRAVLGEFRALHELMRGYPGLVLVVSHDRDERARLIDAGLLQEGFDGGAPGAPGAGGG